MLAGHGYSLASLANGQSAKGSGIWRPPQPGPRPSSPEGAQDPGHTRRGALILDLSTGHRSVPYMWETYGSIVVELPSSQPKHRLLRGREIWTQIHGVLWW